MEFLFASPIISTVVSVAVVIIAFKVAFYTLKNVVVNLVLGFVTYWICTSLLGIHMDIGFGVWALTVLFGPIPMIIAALYYGLF